MRSTPHARGSTLRFKSSRLGRIVYPACAGIHPPEGWKKMEELRLPRMRGDPPIDDEFVLFGRQSTPHARGSTLSSGRMKKLGDVYPACAGIHLKSLFQAVKEEGLPRMRGDPPRFLAVSLR